MSIIITNKKNLCTVVNTAAGIKLEGELISSETQKIVSLNGTFYTTETSEYMGHFNYTETLDGKISRSLGDLVKDKFDDSVKLLTDTIDEIELLETV